MMSVLSDYYFITIYTCCGTSGFVFGKSKKQCLISAQWTQHTLTAACRSEVSEIPWPRGLSPSYTPTLSSDFFFLRQLGKNSKCHIANKLFRRKHFVVSHTEINKPLLSIDLFLQLYRGFKMLTHSEGVRIFYHLKRHSLGKTILQQVNHTQYRITTPHLR